MCGPVRDFKKLHVWQRAMDLIDECYRVTNAFPSSERYALATQARLR
ncbi:MAG: four helix bundle protein [Acidimicrobiia bacterium]